MTIDTSNFQDCLGRIAEKGKISAAQALDILQQVADRGEAMRATGERDPFVAAASELAEKLKQAAKLDHLDALRNATIRARVMGEIERAGGVAHAADTIRSVLHGTNVGGRDSIEARWRGNAAAWQAQLSWALRKAGVEKTAISGMLDREIAEQIWAMNTLGPERAGIPTPARHIAEAIQPLLRHLRTRLNAAGARIGGAVDYVTHTLHDPDKMRAAAGAMRDPPDAAFAAWWRATEPKLAEKTFAGIVPREGESVMEARRRFGRSVFDALVSGVHMTPDGAFGLKDESFTAPSFEGTHNLARRLSQRRVLFWRDGAAWADYMRRFGTPRSLTDGIMRALDSGARHLALLDKLGTNPAANLNVILRRVQERYRDDLDGVRAFQGKIDGLQAVMAHLDGSANIPTNRMAAKIGAAIRTWETMSSLGGVGVTHFASIWPTVTSEMAHHGEARLAVLGNLVHALLKGKGGEERQAMLAELGAFSHGLAREMHARFQADDPVPGRISAMATTFMKYTGIHYVMDTTQAAIRSMLANRLARDAGKSFRELDPHLSQMLGKYGIGPAEWDLLRDVPNLPVAEGLSYMTPRDALRIDPTRARILLRQRGLIRANATKDQAEAASARFAQELADRLYAYYGDAAAHGVVTPGVRERAIAVGRDRPGSIGGEMRRFFMQFKMWPLAAMHQVIGREIHMSLSRREAAWNLGILMALGIPAGYLRMAVNDAALGHPLRDPLDPRTLISALGQSGGMGILGDFLFGETNRLGGGLVSTLAGPAVGDLDELYRIFNRFRADTGALSAGQITHRSGEPYSDLWPDLAHFAVRHVPFANLVYLKGALDYLLWYHLFEAASPGWWERTNRRLIREQGRPMMGYAPGQPIPWTPWSLGQSQPSPQPEAPSPQASSAPPPRATAAQHGPIAMPKID